MPTLLALPSTYASFLDREGPKTFNGWYAPAARGGCSTMKLRFLVYRATYPQESLTLRQVLDVRMAGDTDPRFERYVKQVGDPDGAMNVFDTLDGLTQREDLTTVVPIACFDGEGALVLDARGRVLQFSEEGTLEPIAASFDDFVAALQKKAPRSPDDDE